MLIDNKGIEVLPPFVFNDVQYAPNIEALYSDDELAQLGLTRKLVEPVTSSAPDPIPPSPAPDPNAVPARVTNYQARAALIAAQLFDKADAAVRAANDPMTTAAWDYANWFYRVSPFVSTLGSTLGIADADIDKLFIAAAAVN